MPAKASPITLGNLPLVAVIGRTNVGKSTLVNAIVGKQVALVRDEPGVTRDRTYFTVDRHALPFRIVDTGGLFGEDNNPYRDLVREQAKLAISEANVILCVFDGLHGIHPDDPSVVEMLRDSKAPVLWVINKCEKESTKNSASEFYGLGLEEIHTISAAHRLGTSELCKAIVKEMEKLPNISTARTEDQPLRLSLIGRPNVGKSTLVNQFIGHQRMITSSEAGTTRESVDVEISRNGKQYLIVDTAGLRKKARIEPESLEQESSMLTLGSLARSDVAILVVDATQDLSQDQDLKLASLVHERGIPFIIAVNKWDAIEKDHKSAKEYKEAIRHAFRFCQYAPVLFISALSGRGCSKVLDKATAIFEASRERIPTSELNRVLGYAVEKKPPPVYRGSPIRFFFATQVGVTPPTIVLFLSNLRKIPTSYERYLRNSLRKEFPFEGSEIRMIFRKRSSKEERIRPT